MKVQRVVKPNNLNNIREIIYSFKYKQLQYLNTGLWESLQVTANWMVQWMENVESRTEKC